jgi:hypothetical protein
MSGLVHYHSHEQPWVKALSFFGLSLPMCEVEFAQPVGGLPRRLTTTELGYPPCTGDLVGSGVYTDTAALL